MAESKKSWSERVDGALVLSVRVLFVAGALFLGLGAARDAARFEEEPIATTVDESASMAREGRQWVSVRAGAWRCDEAVVQGIRTLVPARTAAGDLVVARFESQAPCVELTAGPVDGIVELGLDEDIEGELRSAGVVAGSNACQLDVCTDCGRDNARLGVLICSLLFGFALVLPWLRRNVSGVAGIRAAMITAAYAKPGPEEAAANLKVRMYGALVSVLGAGMFAFGDDWALLAVIPLPWFGVFAIALGVLMIADPDRYRRMMRKSVER